MSAPGHSGNDAELVAVFDRRGQIVEVANVLVVQIDVDEAADLPILKDPLGDTVIFLAEIVQCRLNGAAAHFNDGLALRVLPHGRWNMNADRHLVSLVIVTPAPVLVSSRPMARSLPRMG